MNAIALTKEPARDDFDLASKEGLLAYLKALERRFMEIEDHGESEQFRIYPYGGSPTTDNIMKSALKFGTPKEKEQWAAAYENRQRAYEKASSTAILGQNLYLYAVELAQCVRGSRHPDHAARIINSQIEFIGNRNYSVLNNLLGEGAGEKLRKDMIDLGQHCLRILENRDDKLFDAVRTYLKPEPATPLPLGM